MYLYRNIKMRKPSLLRSITNAIRGLWMIFKSERNFQIEVFALLINIFLIFYFHLSTLDAVLIFMVSFMVLSVEIINTAIEKICDFIHPEYDKRIGFIKDIAAGAVTLMAILSVIVGIFVYWKYIF
jgi:diacylglycerol kinase (ATP)